MSSSRIASAGTGFGSLVRVSQRGMSEDSMKKASAARANDDLRAEYDLSQLKGGVRGKYYRRAVAGIDVAAERTTASSRASKLPTSGGKQPRQATEASTRRQIATLPVPCHPAATNRSAPMTMKNPPHPALVVLQECIEPLGLMIARAAAGFLPRWPCGWRRCSAAPSRADCATAPDMTWRCKRSVGVTPNHALRQSRSR